MESGFHTIDRQAWRYCQSLRIVKLPETVVAIEYASFQGCYALGCRNARQVFNQVVFEHFPVVVDAEWNYNLYLSTSHCSEEEGAGTAAHKFILFPASQQRNAIHGQRQAIAGIRS